MNWLSDPHPLAPINLLIKRDAYTIDVIIHEDPIAFLSKWPYHYWGKHPSGGWAVTFRRFNNASYRHGFENFCTPDQLHLIETAFTVEACWDMTPVEILNSIFCTENHG